MKTHVRRPSAGFLLLVVSYVSLVCFFTWGYQKPDLERAWEILQRAQRTSFTGFAQADAQILERLLSHDSRFAHALIGKSPIGFVEPTDDGWMALRESHLVVQSSSTPLRIRIESRATDDQYPLTLLLETTAWQKSVELTVRGSELTDLPAPARATAAWIRVTLKSRLSANSKAAPAAIRIRVEDSDSAKAH